MKRRLYPSGGFIGTEGGRQWERENIALRVHGIKGSDPNSLFFANTDEIYRIKGMSSLYKLSNQQTDHARRKRGWRRLLQFRLLTILLFISLIAGVLGWWVSETRRQREAVAAIQKKGGQVIYDYEFVNYDLPFKGGLEGPRYWPKWMVNWIGIDWFAEVRQVSLGDKHVTNNDLLILKDLGSLQRLSIYNSQITDEGLRYLKNHDSLQELSIENTRITGVGLKYLREFNSLQRLILYNTKITSEGLLFLECLSNLKTLRVQSRDISFEAKTRLRTSLPNCQVVFDKRIY